MKTLPPGLEAHLASGATALATCWKLTRADGATMGFTDHDRDIAFGGTTYEAAGGFTASALEHSSGLAVDNLDVAGALSSARIEEGDLAAGLYDDAEVEIWRVNWQAPAERVLLRKGNIGEVTRGRGSFTAELRGLAHRLNQPTGRIFQYGCDADLGDARCGIDLSSSGFRGEGVVTSAEDDRVIVASGLGGFTAGWFERGKLVFTSGANGGAAMEVKAHALAPEGARLELWRRMARPVAEGDTFTVTAGCDKQFATCRAKFSNGINFRGFPHMPGNDFVVARAGQGPNDGGRRN
ncbi:MAG: beta tubulin [Alphaproteobacteria bacterium HGW-Alphaproteobacteria-11]|nr:MAG: beta tubulin [Alphaproteobacteria bacterium HGW-Alphaproteobacteria-11]